jgi:hypothetical protein
MRNKKKYILFAAVDIGYRIETYTKFIKRYYGEKVQVESFSKYVLPQEHYKTEYTYTCEIYKKNNIYIYTYLFFFFIYSLFRYDTIHYFSGETILTRKLRGLELWIFKLFGKNIVMHFVGSDIRSPQYLINKDKYLEELDAVKSIRLSEDWQLRLINQAIRYSNTIIVSTPDLLKIVPTAKYYPVVIDYDKFIDEINKAENESRNNQYICISHVPSNTKLKGTNRIINILDEFKRNPELKLVLPSITNNQQEKIYSVSRYKLIEIMKNSDILIDQMVIGWYGLQSIEALMAGCKVICYIEEDLKLYLQEGCPIISANINQLKDTISLILNKKDNLDKNKQIVVNRNWVKRYHTIEYNHDILVKAWLLD